MSKPNLIRFDTLEFVAICTLLAIELNKAFNLGVISVLISVLYPIFFSFICAVTAIGIRNRKYPFIVSVVICYMIFLCLNNLSFSKKSINDIDYISILSYNVNSFKGNIESSKKSNSSSQIAKFIDSLKPDICVFQEPTYKGGLNIKGYSYQFLGYRDDIDKSFLTIFSKYPIINKGYLDFPNTKNGSIFADILIKNDTVRIYNVHLQSFGLKKTSSIYQALELMKINYEMQIEQSKIIKSHSKSITYPLIICGDFNATRYSLPYNILKKNLDDSFVRKGFGMGETYELFSYPIRIDHFLYDNIEIENHRNFNMNLSDHEPIIVDIQF